MKIVLPNGKETTIFDAKIIDFMDLSKINEGMQIPVTWSWMLNSKDRYFWKKLE